VSPGETVLSAEGEREREIIARTNRERSQIPSKPFKSNKHLKVTTMAPPKPTDASQTARETRVQTWSQEQLEGDEKQQPEIIDINEIPSPEMIAVNPTLIVEDIQQPQTEAMIEDTPAVV
jgi:hypothetical protein